MNRILTAISLILIFIITFGVLMATGLLIENFWLIILAIVPILLVPVVLSKRNRTIPFAFPEMEAFGAFLLILILIHIIALIFFGFDFVSLLLGFPEG